MTEPPNQHPSRLAPLKAASDLAASLNNAAGDFAIGLGEKPFRRKM